MEFRRAVKEKINEQQMKLVDQTDDANPDADTDISSSMLPGPIKGILQPVQTLLTTVAYILRVISHIVTWEECYYTFWISTVSIGLSIACLFMPWDFIFKWFPKCFAWMVFGPWMSLANRTKSQTKKDLTAAKVIDEFENMSMFATEKSMVKKENKAKERDMKKKLFGKWITTIPTLKVDREIDIPLEDSYATPSDPETLIIKERISGQNSFGNKIPQIDDIKEADVTSNNPNIPEVDDTIDIAIDKNDSNIETNQVVVTAAIVWTTLSFFFSLFR